MVLGIGSAWFVCVLVREGEVMERKILKITVLDAEVTRGRRPRRVKA